VSKREEALGTLLAEIAEDARRCGRQTGRPQLSEAVMAAMAAVPRQAFVARGDEASAFLNRPLPIGHGQTISQPFIVALMSDLLDPRPDERVLEIGTGSGYQTAVLAQLFARVYSVETVQALADKARRRLAKLGIDNVSLKVGDGYEGWPEEAPFDAIIVTAAPPAIPAQLTQQLAVGGRLVIPVGLPRDRQVLVRAVKQEDASLASAELLPVSFVPMVPRGD
jgi:protein-L-isoaspartate(D-aspartate) O-methyltransferase